jgi:hypothetical protein
LEVCLIDGRCRAAVDLDGGLYGENESLPAVRPLMVMSFADSSGDQEAVASWSALIERATRSAYWLELPHSGHLSFTFSQLLSPVLTPPGFDPREGLRIVDVNLRLFIDTHLRGGGASPLGPVAGATDVRWIAWP